MSACDISTATKQWQDTRNNVIDLYSEFWAEGDQRKALKLAIVPMMDRTLQDDLPNGQVSFYSIVVLRCFETVSKIFPNCKAMEIGAKLNLKRWREEASAKASFTNEQARKRIEQKQKETELDGKPLLTDQRGIWMVEESRSASEKNSRAMLSLY